jgi:endonuclease G
MNLARFSIFPAVALLAVVSVGEAGETCGCDVAPARVRAYDAALFTADPGAAAARHAPYGVAVDPAGRFVLLAQAHWLTGYDPRRRLPMWVAYRLTAGDVAAKRTRTGCFRPDPRLSTATGGTRCASYLGDGMDRGHMVASADMTRSERAMVNTYVFSNIAHQYPAFNRSLWRDLEIRVRAMARLRGEIHVMTGAVFDHDRDGLPDAPAAAPYPVTKTGPSDAARASHFYKIVFVPGRGTAPPQISAWLLVHENIRTRRAASTRMLRGARVPLDVIEKMTGLDIAPVLNGVTLAEAD